MIVQPLAGVGQGLRWLGPWVTHGWAKLSVQRLNELKDLSRLRQLTCTRRSRLSPLRNEPRSGKDDRTLCLPNRSGPHNNRTAGRRSDLLYKTLTRVNSPAKAQRRKENP